MNDYDDFVNGAVTTVLWTGTYSKGPDSDLETLDAAVDGVYDDEALKDQIITANKEEWEAFFTEEEDALRALNPDFGQHGHDFVLTTGGHGAGFWDRGYGDEGKRLSEICEGYRSSHAFYGDEDALQYEKQ